MAEQTAVPTPAGAGLGDVDRPGLWRPVTCMAICAIGVGLSIYLTYLHYEPAAISCPLHSGIINCIKVLTSAQSVLFGIPIPFYGLAYFVAMFAMNLPAAWRSRSVWLARARLAAAVVGMCMVLYLVSQELVVIRNICLWCTGVHVLTFVLFLLVLTGWDDTGWARARWAEDDDAR